MKCFCRTRLHYDADKNMHLLVKEMVEAMYQGVSVIFASLDTSYDSVLIYMLQNGFTLLDSRFYTHFQYISLTAFAEATHLADPPVTLDTFLNHAVRLVPKDTKDALMIIDHGSFLGGPYNLTTITSLAQLIVHHSENHGTHGNPGHANQLHTDRKHSVRHKWPDSLSFVFSFDSHVMSSQELIYLLLNVPSLYIDNRIIPHDHNNILRVPSNVGIESLSSILNPLLVVILSKLLSKSESSLKPVSLHADHSMCCKELLALHSRCEAFQSFIEASLAANPNSLMLTKEITELLATRPAIPVSYDHLLAEHAKPGEEHDHRLGLQSTSSQVDMVSPALSVNTDLSWMLSPDYKTHSSGKSRHPLPSEQQPTHDAHSKLTIAYLEHDKKTQHSTKEEPEKKDHESSSDHSRHSNKEKSHLLTTSVPNMGPYLEQILHQSESSTTEQPAVILPAVTKRLTSISSLAWSQPPQENKLSSDSPNNGAIDATIEKALESTSTVAIPIHAPVMPPSLVQSPPVKPQGLRMVTKGKGIKLSSSRPSEAHQAEKT
ncbi:Hypothetical protein GLP15_212 [Giardia lamblia P15]|uniref:Uncharacterized protein n=1 Tax=Giardia intestinalis (strain P15) TaxID=658858 RepID=E1F1I3_GIAIA|nr:Hypothetical protein GLP15_212 [Giardia lamblia P15]